MEAGIVSLPKLHQAKTLTMLVKRHAVAVPAPGHLVQHQPDFLLAFPTDMDGMNQFWWDEASPEIDPVQIRSGPLISDRASDEFLDVVTSHCMPCFMSVQPVNRPTGLVLFRRSS